MREDKLQFIEFTQEHLLDRDLIIRMLKHEEDIATSQWGQKRYKDPLNRVSISLDNEYAFNRRTLHDFGFSNSDQSVQNYRTIFRTYFKDPLNYDKEVIGSSYYMRNNRCVYYTAKPILAGELLPNCRLYMSDGVTETDLHTAIGGDGVRKALVCAFSNS
jgi:hypothetical protein